VAALYAFYQPTQGPFIVVPSTASDTFYAEFTLTSKCDLNFDDRGT